MCGPRDLQSLLHQTQFVDYKKRFLKHIASLPSEMMQSSPSLVRIENPIPSSMMTQSPSSLLATRQTIASSPSSTTGSITGTRNLANGRRYDYTTSPPLQHRHLSSLFASVRQDLVQIDDLLRIMHRLWVDSLEPNLFLHVMNIVPFEGSVNDPVDVQHYVQHVGDAIITRDISLLRNFNRWNDLVYEMHERWIEEMLRFLYGSNSAVANGDAALLTSPWQPSPQLTSQLRRSPSMMASAASIVIPHGSDVTMPTFSSSASIIYTTAANNVLSLIDLQSYYRDWLERQYYARPALNRITAALLSLYNQPLRDALIRQPQLADIVYMGPLGEASNRNVPVDIEIPGTLASSQ